MEVRLTDQPHERDENDPSDDLEHARAELLPNREAMSLVEPLPPESAA